MKIEDLYREIDEFSSKTHGSSDYHKDNFFIKGGKAGVYAPLSYLKKKSSDYDDLNKFLAVGFIQNAYNFFEQDDFRTWYENQFARKLQKPYTNSIVVVEIPNNQVVLDTLEGVSKCYEVLRRENIIMNGKNLPTQMGEWYAKSIFGLTQVRSTSQRGFDFFMGGHRAEVKVHWADQSSPKGVKIRKSLVDLSDFTIIVYLTKNFFIRELCILDSAFVLRKFSSKGHTMFLKDQDVSQYFFSNSDKQKDKVANPTSMLKYATPGLAMKLTEWFPGIS